VSVRPKRNLAQSVRTRNVLEADRPLVCPVVVTLWSPGLAERGTLTDL
jgi:hypothetical protein